MIILNEKVDGNLKEDEF